MNASEWGQTDSSSKTNSRSKTDSLPPLTMRSKDTHPRVASSANVSKRLDDDDIAREVNRQATESIIKWVMGIVASIASAVIIALLFMGLRTMTEVRDDSKMIQVQVAQGATERLNLGNKIEKWGERFDQQQKNISDGVAKLEAVTFRVGATESALQSITQQLTDVRERQLRGQETMAEIRTELTMRGALTPKK